MAITQALGFAAANGGKYYAVKQNDVKYVILRKYGDKLICAKVDSATDTVTKIFRVLSIGTEQQPLDIFEFGSVNKKQ